jgi:hypothetical protein
MSRLARFEHFRFVGDRRTMKVYDCDEPAQYEAIASLIGDEDLVGGLQVQSFAPDTLDEARNRGFRPV